MCDHHERNLQRLLIKHIFGRLPHHTDARVKRMQLNGVKIQVIDFIDISMMQGSVARVRFNKLSSCAGTQRKMTLNNIPLIFLIFLDSPR